MVVYHAERPSHINTALYLSGLNNIRSYRTLADNSLKYNVAVTYCIFVTVFDIRYRSKGLLVLNCEAKNSLSLIFAVCYGVKSKPYSIKIIRITSALID